MKTSTLGFPRIGRHRELKFACECFFAGKVTLAELENTAAQIRRYGWEKQKAAGISLIPSNDFSYYDNILDTAILLNAIPERYKALKFPALKTYFAMAHGYQGNAGDVKALPMKKWFNTNYHYIVPELEDTTEIRACENNAAVNAYNEAKSLGIETVPILFGPYTFLHFAKVNGTRSKKSFESEISNAFAQIILSLEKAGAKAISIAEPSLVFDISTEEKNQFKRIHLTILEKIRKKSQIKIYLQTYFGDIRDSYQLVTSIPFDGFGLDFVEGKKTLQLLQSGFPKGALLFAGIVNGKNIWRTNYEQKNQLISEIQKIVDTDRIVISTSCSLLHVPYTTMSETKLDASVLKHFSFAEEKLRELVDISRGEVNKELFDGNRITADEKVQKALAALNDSDFVRLPVFASRETIQHQELNLPLFPTTTIGSFPQTKEIRENRAAFRKGLISKEQYEDFNKKKIAECIALQEKIGLDVIVHGEFERNDMVEYFGNHLNGFLFTENAWVQSYGTRCVKPPIIWGDISRKEAITVPWSVYAQSLTQKPVKGMLTGPVTILNWSFPREDISMKTQMFEIALAIRKEVLDLEAHGIRIIQIDEAAFREKLPLRKADWHSEYLNFAIAAFCLVHSGVKPKTQIHTHMCYSEFNDIVRDIDAMDADVITFEASRSSLKILDTLQEANFKTEVGPGVYDIHSPRIPSKNEIVSALNIAVTKVKKEKLWVNPDCGLKTRNINETIPSLTNLVAAAKELRKRFE